ncbi:hypothetical protein [Acutalibacter sp. 1XD8-33]|nr:hypothetical protein [Acutalibacter sp. 1XD8-33]
MWSTAAEFFNPYEEILPKTFSKDDKGNSSEEKAKDRQEENG